MKKSQNIMKMIVGQKRLVQKWQKSRRRRRKTITKSNAFQANAINIIKNLFSTQGINDSGVTKPSFKIELRIMTSQT